MFVVQREKRKLTNFPEKTAVGGDLLGANHHDLGLVVKRERLHRACVVEEEVRRVCLCLCLFGDIDLQSSPRTPTREPKKSHVNCENNRENDGFAIVCLPNSNQVSVISEEKEEGRREYNNSW